MRVAEVATNTLLMIFKDYYLQSEPVTSEMWTEKRRESFDTTVAVLKLLMQTDLMAIFCLFGSVEGVSALLKETSSYSSLLFYQKRKHRIMDNHFYYLLCGTALFNYLCTSLKSSKHFYACFFFFILSFEFKFFLITNLELHRKKLKLKYKRILCFLQFLASAQSYHSVHSVTADFLFIWLLNTSLWHLNKVNHCTTVQPSAVH